MRRTVILVTLLYLPIVMCGRTNAQSAKKSAAKEIEWQRHYAIARKDAARKQLPLMLYFTFEECFHAKRFEKTTLRDATVLATLEKNFVCVKIDVKTQEALAKEFRVTGCPAMVFLAPDGEQVRRVEGYQDVPAFVEHLRKALPGK